MKIQFNGSSAVDIDGHDGVEPGAVVDVPDALAAQLLAAGTEYPTDGAPIPPTAPLWTVATKPTKGTTPAVTGEES